jgi:L-rhamnose isomerase
MDADGKKPGSKVGEWVRQKASKVVAGGVSVGAKIGSEILTAWIKQHYGL